MQQADLFDTASGLPTGPEGLTYRSDVIDTATEAHLIAAVDALPLAPFRFQGWLGKRLTCSFGWSYDFDTAQVAAAPPIPDWLMPIRRKAAELLAIGEAELVQALLIRYDPGAGIGWHRDRPIFGHVAGLSLGAPATLRLRRRRENGFDRHPVSLARRSLYGLSGPVRTLWEHSIAPMEDTRWSITFRSLTDKGRRLLG
ncbi:alpha-ketoglutarate-dependent dioxygenase AlkB [Sphingomonas bisphenolicum]|uniref:2OG-Fe(II) oxygenase n=1 Tax=Sphingomonas bisphenolicum TaxID=296544 RepID=A0ABM7G743_9SPHN|nr:alpha-ketoglutarate-dependent dioxygenase AlkB [Sphingomonas bisphenolicum]BBF70561.1 2OG-Fe(II) oxygenase [Sphingomonas bisphenolicum]